MPIPSQAATEVELLLIALYTATFPDRAMAEFAARYITKHKGDSRVAYGPLKILEAEGGWMLLDQDARP